MDVPRHDGDILRMTSFHSPRACRIFNVDTNPEEIMRARVQKWGNSLALRIPRSFAEEAGISEGCTIDMSLEDGVILVRAVREGPWKLDELVAEITDENLHDEWDSGSGAGGEAW
jgi:antitoxin MazE